MPVGDARGAAGALVAVRPHGAGARRSVSPAAREAFDRGRTAFGRAEYQRAIDILHPLLYPEVVLDSEGEVVQAHRMLGVALPVRESARRGAPRVPQAAGAAPRLPLRSAARPAAGGRLLQRRAQGGGERRSRSSRRGASKRETELAARRLETRPAGRASRPSSRYEQHSFAINFIPFGAGQFQNGERRKGWVFLGIETRWPRSRSARSRPTSRSTASADPRAAWMRRPAARPAVPQCMNDRSLGGGHRRATLLGVQLVSGGLFFAVAVWGVVDAIRNFQPEVRSSAGTAGARVGARRATARLTRVFDPRGRRPPPGRFAERKPATMATLKCVPGKGAKVYHIYKKITSLGRSEEADMMLPDPMLAESHAHIHFDGRDFNIATTERDAELFVNGRKRNKHRLAHEDRVRLGMRRARVLALRRAGHRRVRRRKYHGRANSYKKLLRVLAEADGELRAADAAGPAAGRDDPGHQRRQGLPGADGVGRAGGQGGAQPAPRDHLRRRQPAVRLDPRARGEDAEAAHHLGRAQRRGVQELAVGREPEADVGHVRAAARARQHAGRHLRRQRQRRRSCSTSRTWRC